MTKARRSAYALAYAVVVSMSEARKVSLFRNGRNQAVRIPVEFELPGDTALIHREGNRLVIEPIKKRDIFEVLAGLGPIEEEFPDVDEGLGPLRDIDL